MNDGASERKWERDQDRDRDLARRGDDWSLLRLERRSCLDDSRSLVTSAGASILASPLSFDGDLLDRPLISRRRSGLLDGDKDFAESLDRDLEVEGERRRTGRLRRGEGEREGLSETEDDRDILRRLTERERDKRRRGRDREWDRERLPSRGPELSLRLLLVPFRSGDGESLTERLRRPSLSLTSRRLRRGGEGERDGDDDRDGDLDSSRPLLSSPRDRPPPDGT